MISGDRSSTRSNRTSLFHRLAILAGFLIWPALANAELQQIDGIAAIVNDDVIMRSEVNERLRMVEYDMKQRGGKVPPANILQQQVLDRMVMELIQMQIADRYGIRIDDQTLNQTMTRIAQDNGLSLDAFRYALEADGVEYERAREQVRRELLISRVRQRQVMDRIQVTPQEVANFLKSPEGKTQTAAEYRLGHILVPLSEGADTIEKRRAQQLAQKIYNELRAGASFSDVAASFSTDAMNLRGGDLGWRKTAELPTIFADAVPNLKTGQIAEPIESPSGFHIIKLQGVRGGDVTFVKETRARHILIRPSEIRSDQEARELARELRNRIRRGEDFADLARAFSDDSTSARKGGELGWLSPGTTVPEFEKVMNNIVLNELSQPFRSSFGWHVLQVLERRDTDKSDEFRNRQAQNILRQRKFEEALGEWLAEVREEAYVEVKI